MKLVTFNIRYDCGQDGINVFSNRKAIILTKLRQENPDIICFQEVLPHVASWLKQNLTEYYVVGCPRGENLDNEQTCICYRFDRYELLRMEAYWLSPTPEVPGSRYEAQSICPRICTEVILREFSSGIVFRLTNTHLDHEGHIARCLAAEQIIRKHVELVCFPDAPSILVGDMNAEPGDPEIELLQKYFQNQTNGIGPTFHGFGTVNPVQIDYIFTHGKIQCKSADKWMDQIGGIWLSDHYPVCAELEFE